MQRFRFLSVTDACAVATPCVRIYSYVCSSQHTTRNIWSGFSASFYACFAYTCLVFLLWTSLSVLPQKYSSFPLLQCGLQVRGIFPLIVDQRKRINELLKEKCSLYLTKKKHRKIVSDNRIVILISLIYTVTYKYIF